MGIAEDILKDLNFKPHEIELYNKIRLEIFLKNSAEDIGSLVSKISKMIDEVYSE